MAALGLWAGLWIASEERAEQGLEEFHEEVDRNP